MCHSVKGFLSLPFLNVWNDRRWPSIRLYHPKKSFPSISQSQEQLVSSRETNDRSSSKCDGCQTPSSALVHKKLISPQELLLDISRASFALNRQTDMGQLMLPRVGSRAEGSACNLGLSSQLHPCLFLVPSHTWGHAQPAFYSLHCLSPVSLCLPSVQKDLAGEKNGL